MQDLKLIALDADDLAVVSAHLQDAVVRMGDIAYLKREKRLVAILNRFDWPDAASKRAGARAFTRRQSGLRLERVLGAKVSGLDLAAKDTVLSLLSIAFEATDEAAGPEGHITLAFSGGGAIRLAVECIEAELKDLGAAWTTRKKPMHVSDDQDEGS